MNKLEASVLLEESLEFLSPENAGPSNEPARQAYDRLLAFRDGWFRAQREAPRHPPKVPSPPMRYMGTSQDE